MSVEKAMSNDELDIAYKKIFAKYLLQGVIMTDPKIISANLGIEEEIEFLPPDKPVARTDQKYCKRGDHSVDRKEFHKSSSTVDGLASWCKHCTKKYQEEYYKTRPRKRGHFVSEGIDREEVQALIKHHEERLNYLRTLI